MCPIGMTCAASIKEEVYKFHKIILGVTHEPAVSHFGDKDRWSYDVDPLCRQIVKRRVDIAHAEREVEESLIHGPVQGVQDAIR